MSTTAITGATGNGAASDAAPARDEMPDVLHLYRTGALDEAEARCRAIVERDPGRGAAWDRLAHIAEQRGQMAAAEAHYHRAITTLADPAEAHSNLAVLLQRRGDLAGAQEHYRRAIALGMRHAMLHSNYGCALRGVGRLQESAEEFERALALDDALAHAHSNLGVTLALQGEIAGAVAHGRRAVALQPEWELARNNLLFCLNYADDLDADQIAAPHLAFGRRRPAPDELAPELDADADPDRRLRIGLVSPDFKQHSVAYFIEPILEACDRDRDALELTCYADVPSPDAVSERLRAAADRLAARPPPRRRRRQSPDMRRPHRHPDRSRGPHRRQPLVAVRVARRAGADDLSRLPEHHWSRHRRLAHHRRVGQSPRHHRITAQRGAAAHHRRIPVLPAAPGHSGAVAATFAPRGARDVRQLQCAGEDLAGDDAALGRDPAARAWSAPGAQERVVRRSGDARHL